MVKSMTKTRTESNAEIGHVLLARGPPPHPPLRSSTYVAYMCRITSVRLTGLLERVLPSLAQDR
jgi:hypothetical protein